MQLSHTHTTCSTVTGVKSSSLSMRTPLVSKTPLGKPGASTNVLMSSKYVSRAWTTWRNPAC
jgi:hypothetical protein